MNENRPDVCQPPKPETLNPDAGAVVNEARPDAARAPVLVAGFDCVFPLKIVYDFQKVCK